MYRNAPRFPAVDAVHVAVLCAARRRGRAATATEAGCGEHRVDAHRLGAGAVHDAARAGAVLRRAGAHEERALRAHAVLRHHLHGDARLGGGRATASPSATAARSTPGTAASTRRSSPASTSRRSRAASRRPCSRCSSSPSRSSRRRWSSAPTRSACKFSGMLLFSLLWLLARLLPDRALGLGRRLAAEDGHHGFRRRHGGAPERRHRGAGLRAGARAGAGAFPTRRCRRTT